MARTEVRGRFVWHELLTTDVTAARAFYPKIMGWSPQALGTDSSYTLWMVRGAPVGGLMALPEEAKAMGAPPNWLTYIGTPDVDGTVKRATELGAKVLKAPDTVAGAGRFAVLADPQGAVFGVLAPENPSPAGRLFNLGDFSWHELATTDPASAFRFYGTLFGWEQTDAMDMGPAGIHQMYGWEGLSKGGMYTKPADVRGPSYWLPYALVPDVDRAAAQASANGAQIVNGPMDVPGGGRIAVLCDLQGAAFAVHAKAGITAVPRRKPRVAKRTTRKKAARKKALGKTLKKRAGRKQAARKKASAKRKPVRRGSRPAVRERATRKRPARRPRRPKRPARKRPTRRKPR